MLCRACGNELIPFEYCPDCDEAIHWRCSICEKENEKSVHSHYLNNQIQRKASMAGASCCCSHSVPGLSSAMLI